MSAILPPRLLGSAAASAVGMRVFPRADRALQKISRGRTSLTAVTGMPLLLLETTGRRSGQLRVSPLIYATQGADFLVAGSNWGQEKPPAWALNLTADSNACVCVRGTRIPVTAQLLRDAEREDAWPLLLELWPAYDEYARRVRATSGREIMVFRLRRRGA